MKMLITTVGEEEKPLVEGLKRVPHLELVIYLASNKTLPTAQKLSELFKELYKSKIIVIEPSNIGQIIKELINIYSTYSDYEIFYNISGGTKLMSLACFTMALFNNNPIFYVFLEDDNKTMTTYDLPIPKFNIEDFLKENSREKNIIEEINSNEGITATELSKKLKLKVQTISGYLRRIEEKYGFIERKKINKRQYGLKITESGKILISILEARRKNKCQN